MDLDGATVVDLRGHCAFCRRRLKEREPQYIEESHGSHAAAGESKWRGETKRRRLVTGEDRCDTGGEQEVVPKAVIKVPFVSFSHIWGYLLKTGAETAESESGSHKSLFVKYQFAIATAEDGNYLLEIPPMCHCCGERIQELEQLHKELMQKVEDIKRIVAESCSGGKYSWRNEELEKALGGSSLEAFMKVSSFQFLNSLMVSSSSRKSLPERSKAAICYEVKEEVDSPISTDEDYEKEGDSCGEFQNDDTPPDRQSFFNSDDDDDKKFIDDCDEEPSTDLNKECLTSVRLKHTANLKKFKNSSEKDCATTVQRLNKLNRQAKCQKDDDDDFTECSNSDIDVALPTQRVPLPGQVEDEEVESQNSAHSFEAECLLNDDVNSSLNNDSEDDSSMEYQNEVIEESEEGDSSSEDDKISKSAPGKKSSKAYFTRKVKGITQQCDLCKERIPFPKIRQHLESHNVQEYICKCPNPECNFTFSNRRSLDALHLWDRKSRFIKCRNVFIQLNNNQASSWSRVCETCGATPKTVMSLRKHLSRTHEIETSKNYTCPISDCSKRFSVKQSLEFHLDCHKLGGQHKQRCPLCRDHRRRTNKEEIMDHFKKIHNVEEIFECKQCTFLFPTREHLLEHLRQHRHSGILCDICDDEIKHSSYDEFREHYASVHRIGAAFSCKDCDEAFYMKGKLEEHIRAQHPPSCAALKRKRKYKKRQIGIPRSENLKLPRKPCDACSKTFKSEDNLYAHKIKEHGAEILRCKFCDLTFLLKRVLERHEKMHGGTKEFKCGYDNCNKAFLSRGAYYRHRRYHQQARMVCDICEKEFKSKIILKQHINSVHLRLKKFVCEVCGVGLATFYGLILHRRTHSGERPYVCKTCSKTFICKTTLSKHLLTHSQSQAQAPKKTSRDRDLRDSFGLTSRKNPPKKTIICETCGNGFVSTINLRKHKEAFHTDTPNRGIVCDVCGDTLSSDQSLIMHMRIHTGERPYACHICENNQPFRTRTTLTAHLRRHKLKGEKFRPRGPVENFKRKRREPSSNIQNDS